MQGFTILFYFLAQGVLLAIAVAFSLNIHGFNYPDYSHNFVFGNETIVAVAFLVVVYVVGILAHSLIFSVLQGRQGKRFRDVFTKQSKDELELWNKVFNRLKLPYSVEDVLGEIKAEKAKRVLNLFRDYLLVHNKEVYDRNVSYRNQFRMARGIIIPSLIVLGACLIKFFCTSDDWEWCKTAWVVAVSLIVIIIGIKVFIERLNRYYKMVINSVRMSYIYEIKENGSE